MPDLKTIQEAIRRESLDGWLFYGYRHRDPIADRIMGIPADTVNSRPWFAVLFPDREPLLLVHGVESHILDHLGGKRTVYTAREELRLLLGTLGPGRFAAQYSRENPAISTLDHGTAAILEEAGLILVDSGSLIQRTLGLLSDTEIESHERAAAHLYAVVEGAWSLIRERFASGRKIAEGEIQEWILSQFRGRSLVTDHPPIVAFGKNSGDPHYEPSGSGAVLSSPGVLQLDMWAKENRPDAIYADISWIGVCSAKPSAEEELLFRAVTGARDRGIAFVKERISVAAGAADDPAGAAPAGAEVDAEVRRFIESAGYGNYIKHRTGHGIDREVHGFGVNIDSVEFPDSRRLLPGSCFSIEPGIYLEQYGMRTEIDMYIRKGKAVVSGGPIQKELLRL